MRRFVLFLILTLVSCTFACNDNQNIALKSTPTSFDSISPSPTVTATTSPSVTPSPSISPTPVLGEIDILSTSTEIDFPSTLTFFLEAESPDTINDITLRYKVNKIALVQLVSEAQPEFEEGSVVVATWEWDMRKYDLPPGAVIEYQWILEDIAGRKSQTRWEELTFHDTRFDWNIKVEGNVTLYWYDGAENFGQELMDAAQNAMVKLVSGTGAYLERPIKIYIYGSQQDLLDV